MAVVLQLSIFVGNIFSTTKSDLVSGHKKCDCQKEKYNFSEKVRQLTGDEYSVCGEYIDSKTPILIKHNKCGRKYTVIPHFFISGNRCPYCSKTGKMDDAALERKIAKKTSGTYKLLSTGYVNNSSDITVQNIKTGAIKTLKAKSFFKRKNYTDEKEITTESFKEEVLKLAGEDYTVIGEYINGDTKLEFRHLDKHNFFMRPHNFRQGNRCPVCAKKYHTSAGEKEVLLYIKSIYPGKVMENYKDGAVELDIYIPEKKLGIEYDGLYWHCEENKEKYNLKNKTDYFKEKGIRVIHIFEDEYRMKRDIVNRKLDAILGASKERVYARKCEIREITVSEKNKFLESNHIQGKDTCRYANGLFYEGELVAVMTFSKLRKCLGQNSADAGVYELSRFATSKTVVGGFSRLLKHSIKAYGIKKIITYADLRYSDREDNVYLKNGFKFIRISDPSYYYFSTFNKRYHRYTFRKQVLDKKFPELYDPELTEYEIMRKAKYHRIWDCGNLVYQLDIE